MKTYWIKGLNPRFDGAFLNFKALVYGGPGMGLNPRFDGAFLNFHITARAAVKSVS